LLLPVAERLGGNVTLRLIEHADHSFHVPLRSGRSDQQAMDEVLDTMADWMAAVSNEIDGVR
jgi:hypothetical protein